MILQQSSAMQPEVHVLLKMAKKTWVIYWVLLRGKSSQILLRMNAGRNVRNRLNIRMIFLLEQETLASSFISKRGIRKLKRKPGVHSKPSVMDQAATAMFV